MPIVKPIERILMTPFGMAEADLIWIGGTDVPSEYHCTIFETLEIWWFPQPLVRGVKSMSAWLRGKASPIILPEPLLVNYKEHILRHKQSPFYERVKNG